MKLQSFENTETVIKKSVLENYCWNLKDKSQLLIIWTKSNGKYE